MRRGEALEWGVMEVGWGGRGSELRRRGGVGVWYDFSDWNFSVYIVFCNEL